MHDAAQGAATPIILFGAFDRHNFGDLLFPHIAVALLGDDRETIFAGLAERDLRGYGGHRVRSLAQLAAEWNGRPVHIVHVGGELLSCDAWQAAAMLQPREQAAALIASLDRHRTLALQWARTQLGIPALAPYTVSRSLFSRAKIIYNAVGGVDLGECDAAMQDEVFANLRAADAVAVRDGRTRSLLTTAGVNARLLPDPAVMVAELFGATIRRYMQQGAVAPVLHAYPHGYIAVQFSADFGDGDTLAYIAAQLDEIAHSTGFGIAFFRAGAAPWHDDLSCYQQVAARMRAPSTIFTSLNLWDICALIAGSRAYLGSSLHGRLVAIAFALPRVNLHHPMQAGRITKQTAFAAAWEERGMPVAVGVDGIAEGVRHALSIEPERLRHISTELAARYRQGCRALYAELE